MLDKAHVNSITCFARCHHGWLYYASKAFPERIHPQLQNKDLLRQQIEACHKRNILVPVYLSVQWDHYTSQRHPEWCILDADGQLSGTGPYEAGFYRCLCVNSPYLDFLKAHTKEILDTFDVDGLFCDIVFPFQCSCRHCMTEMIEKGYEPSNENDRIKFGRLVTDRFKDEMTALVRKTNRNCRIFYNEGHIGPAHRAVKDAYSHFELESLPGGAWGYIHFDTTMPYARTLGLDCLSHTGKFHTSWGDFHSFKNRAALEFECFRMLAMNSKCLIGDQLEPNGKICPHVYELIGSVYRQVEKKEPWCSKAKSLTDIGIVTPEAFRHGFTGTEQVGKIAPSMAGIVRMMLESGHQYDVLDAKADFSKYKVVVLPDNVQLGREQAQKIETYLDDGGSLIASFESGMNPAKTAFALKPLGVEFAGDAPIAADGKPARGRSLGRGAYTDYILPDGPIGKNLPTTEHAMYLNGVRVIAEPNCEVLANVIASYFNRSYRRFCSHAQAPSAHKTDYPGIVRNGRAIYFSHPIFTQYYDNAPRWCKQLFLNAIDLLLETPLIRHDGPTTLRVTLNEQTHRNRWVLHLLHYIPERRSQTIEIIEDVIPVSNIKLTLRTNKPVKAVRCVPAEKILEFEQNGSVVEFTVDEVNGHQMVELSFR